MIEERTGRPRIGFLTPWDVGNPNAWSGVVAPMLNALQSRTSVVPMPTAGVPTALVDRMLARALGAVSEKGYRWDQAVATSRSRGRNATRLLAEMKPDVVLAVAASQDLAFIRAHGTPIVQVADATFAAIKDYYPLFSNLHPLSVVQQEHVARRSTAVTDRFAMATRWSIDSLVSDYGVDEDRCVLAPFGPALEEKEAPVRQFTDGQFHALVVTSDWERKGGDLAVRVIERLRQDHPGVGLTVVGSAPSGLPSWVENLGRLPRQELAEQYKRADVLLELATANCGGVTLTDAAAFGLPVVATDTGGVSSIVVDGLSGLLVPAGGVGTFDAATEAVSRLLDGATRQTLSQGARQQHEESLNWGTWADKVVALCGEVVRPGYQNIIR